MAKLAQKDTPIILYSIELDGCLNGVYTHQIIGGEILNEICRKVVNDKKLDGDYKCFWFDINNTPYQRDLRIMFKAPNLYTFIWSVAGKPILEGKGYRMNERQIAVSYWEI